MEAYIFIAFLITFVILIAVCVEWAVCHKAVKKLTKINYELIDSGLEICKWGEETSGRNIWLLKEGVSLREEILELTEANIQLTKEKNDLLHYRIEDRAEIDRLRNEIAKPKSNAPKSKNKRKLPERDGSGRFVKKDAPAESIPVIDPELKYIRLLGVDWLTENLKDEQGVQLHTQEEALRLAKDKGLKIPSINILEDLKKLPRAWDSILEGYWLAEDEKDFKNPERSLFLPSATRIVLDDGTLSPSGSYGYYWSSTQFGNLGGFMHIDDCGTYATSTTIRSSRLTVRCIKK